MTHALIIRFHYEKGDPRYAWRFAYFQSMVLPRILNQTVKDFDIYVRCNPWQVDDVKELDPRIKILMVERERVDYKTHGGKKYFVDFIPWKQVLGMKKYEIQSGLDSDDLIAPDYMQTVREYIEEYKNVGKPKSSVHVSFQPQIFDLKTLSVRPIGTTYTPTKGSAFLSLYQPEKTEPYRFIYEESHLKMWKFADHSVVVQEGQCWATVHRVNESTGK